MTSPQAFAELRARGLRVRRPERTVATMDHAIPTRRGPDGRRAAPRGAAAEQVAALERNCREFGVTLYPVGDERQGIVHVIGPELGLTQPGLARSSAATATPARTAPSARWPSASARARSATCSRRSACCSAGRGRSRSTFSGRLAPGVTRQGPDPRPDRAHRHRRRQRPRDRVPRQRDPRALDGRADDGLQHVDRGRRARRAWSRPTTPPSSTSPAGPFAPKGAAWDAAARALARAAERRGRRVRPRAARSTPRRSSR